MSECPQCQGTSLCAQCQLASILQLFTAGNLAPLDALNQFQHCLQPIRGVIEQARLDLQPQLELEGEVADAFGILREAADRELGMLGDLFEKSVSIHDFEHSYPQMEQCLERLTTALGALEAFVDHWRPTGPPPLSPELRDTLEALQGCLDCFTGYGQRRERAWLEELVRQLDRACAGLKVSLALTNRSSLLREN